MGDSKFSEVSLGRAYDFILDMDTVYSSTDDTDAIAKAFREVILKKYDVNVLPDLVALLFDARVPQNLIAVESKDKHRLMRLCYNLRKLGENDVKH